MKKVISSLLSSALLVTTLAAPQLTATAQKRSEAKTAAPRPAVADAPSETAARQDTPQKLKGARIESVTTSTVNMRELSENAAANPAPADAPVFEQAMPAPGTIQEVGSPKTGGKSGFNPRGGVRSSSDEIPQPNVPSPSPSQSFLAHPDGPQVGTGTFNIPPDTTGAVGTTQIITYLNNNFVVQDKATGTQLSAVSGNTFWLGTGAVSTFDPRVLYDPYNNRWIVVAVAEAQQATSSVLVAISNTADALGTYTRYRYVVGCAAGATGCNAAGEWADFPMIGFNRNHLAISWNQFTINTSAFVTGKILVLDYPTLRGGTAPASTIFSGAPFCLHPATTFSATENTLYFIAHLSSGGATYVVGRMTGTPTAPAIALGATQTRPGGGWTQPNGDITPQQCVPGVGAPTQTCPTTLRFADAGDAFVRSNAVFRNGKIWYAQAIVLPTGGITVNSRQAAQWTALNASDGTFSQGGRVEDPTATRTNGGKHYTYPSISVNKNDDVMLGFTEAESDGYLDAGYTYRFAGDPAGTMRETVITKAGEDYYSKTFGGTRNRWGDYSHVVVDPVNDRDLWTIQEYAGLRVGTTGQGSNDSRWSTWWSKVTGAIGATDMNISEFRLRGPSGAQDEFIELYNSSGSALTVAATGTGTGFGVAASDGTVRCTIPNGTVIPAGGHYLCANSVAYSLSGNATGNATYTTDIPDNAGIALFNTNVPAEFSLATRIDAAGSTSEANTLYKEGTGYPSINPTFDIDYSFVRDNCGKAGSITLLGQCPAGGNPVDTGNNAADFYFVDTNGTPAGAGQRLGAPGPENLASPIQRNASVGAALLDGTVGSGTPPNRVRDLTSDPPNNSTFGTLDIRRRFTNNTGAPLTRLRFRVIDITTFPAPSGFADLRTRTSSLVVVSGVNDSATCLASNGVATTPCTVNVQGSTLEQPPSQPNGGAFNSTYSSGTITLGTPLANGASVNLRFLLGIQQTGTFKFLVNIEALP